MNIKKKFINSGGAITISGVQSVDDFLQPGVYKLHVGMDGPTLSPQFDRFDLPNKIYGNDEAFAGYVIKTYQNANTNVGVALIGMKGTGKSLTAMMIANMSQLPVIIVSTDFGEVLPAFVAAIDQPLCVFIDEFEKVYTQEDSKIHPLLVMMDGLRKKSRILTILTSNSDQINSNLKSRPGRVRYLKQYSNLTTSIIREIVEDTLEDKSFTDEVIKAIAGLRTITMDIVDKVIQEVNIHRIHPKEFLKFFNVERMLDRYELYAVVNGAEALIHYSVDLRVQQQYRFLSPYEKNTEKVVEDPRTKYQVKVDNTVIGTTDQQWHVDGILNVHSLLDVNAVTRYRVVKTSGVNNIYKAEDVGEGELVEEEEDSY